MEAGATLGRLGAGEPRGFDVSRAVVTTEQTHRGVQGECWAQVGVGRAVLHQARAAHHREQPREHAGDARLELFGDPDLNVRERSDHRALRATGGHRGLPRVRATHGIEGQGHAFRATAGRDDQEAPCAVGDRAGPVVARGDLGGEPGGELLGGELGVARRVHDEVDVAVGIGHRELHAVDAAHVELAGSVLQLGSQHRADRDGGRDEHVPVGLRGDERVAQRPLQQLLELRGGQRAFLSFDRAAGVLDRVLGELDRHAGLGRRGAGQVVPREREPRPHGYGVGAVAARHRVQGGWATGDGRRGPLLGVDEVDLEEVVRVHVLGGLVDEPDHVVLGLGVHAHPVERLQRARASGLDPLDAQAEGLACERRRLLDVHPEVVRPGALALRGQPQDVMAYAPGIVGPGRQCGREGRRPGVGGQYAHHERAPAACGEERIDGLRQEARLTAAVPTELSLEVTEPGDERRPVRDTALGPTDERRRRRTDALDRTNTSRDLFDVHAGCQAFSHGTPPSSRVVLQVVFRVLLSCVEAGWS